jgi:Regulator of G protein signaling domain
LYNRPFSFAEKARAAEEAAAAEDPNKPVNQMEIARRAEIETIKNLFLLPGSPKELNIPSPMRRKVLDAMQITTDAKIFAPIAEHCHLLLKSCSHRNFIRLGVSNGTFETICMATGLGIVLTITGIMAMLLLAFVSPGFRQCSRWRGIGIWPMWSVGVGLILSGLRGSCFFLLLFSRRQPLPWERFEDDAVQAKKKKNKFIALVSKLMIFDRKLKVKDDNLRRLQRKVVMQSLLGGAAFATIMVVVFLCLPIWKEI